MSPMPITFHIDKNKDLTVFKAIGLLSFEATMSAVMAFYESEPTRLVLWDATNATDVQFTSEELIAIVEYRARYEGKRGSGKTAIVAHKDVVFGLSRVFEMQSSLQGAPYDIMVFRNIDEANQWLEES
jgi:hypothetical protein